MWDIYNTIREVESSFRILKTDLSLRPVYHIHDNSCKAHLFLGVLAYTIVSTIRYKLKQHGIQHDWKNIVRIMNTQKIITSVAQNANKKNSHYSAMYKTNSRGTSHLFCHQIQTCPLLHKTKDVVPKKRVAITQNALLSIILRNVVYQVG